MLLAAVFAPSVVRAQEPAAPTTEAAADADPEAAADDATDAEPLADVDAAADASDAAAAADADADAAADEEDDGPLTFTLPLVGATTFSMTSTTSARFRGQNYNGVPISDKHYDDDFLSFQQRLDLSLSSETLRLEARLVGFQPLFFDDGVSTHQACTVDDAELCELTNDYRLERISMRWDHDEWSVVLGDHYAILGRGIALSFRKADLVGVDNSLRGGRVAYEGETLYVRAVGGVANPQNLDPTNLVYIPEPTDVVVGAEFGMRLGELQDLEFGFHATRIWFEDDPGAVKNDRSVDVAGWHASMPALVDGQLALYVEANALRRTWSDFRGEEREYGRAVYGSAQLQLERVTVLAEWVDYRGFLVAAAGDPLDAWRIYSSVPTLELDGLQRLRAVGNRRGGSVKFDYAFLPGPWSFSVNALVYGFEEHTADPWDGIFVAHGWLGLRRFSDQADDGSSAGAEAADEGAGATSDGEDADGEEEQGLSWSFETLVGFRRETFLHDPMGSRSRGDLDRQVAHGEIDLSLAAGKHSLELRIDQRFERELRAIDYADFTQGGVALTWSYDTRLSISPTVRWSDEKANVTDARAERSYNFLGGSAYPALEVKWHFTAENFVSLFAGSTPAGRFCSGGVCREVQAFEGFLAQLVLRI